MQGFGELPLAQLRATSGPAEGNSAAPSTVTAAPAAAPVAPVAPVATTQGAGTTSIAASGAAGADPKAAAPGSSILTFLPIILMMGVLYLFMFRGQRKTEKKRKSMLTEMKKGDQVMTIGGLVARVVSIEDDQVVLKIDESANVKATYKKSAIQQVLTPEEK